MSAPLLCPKAYHRDGPRKPIICRNDGLKEFKILENYIPFDMSGLQKKLIQEGNT